MIGTRPVSLAAMLGCLVLVAACGGSDDDELFGIPVEEFAWQGVLISDTNAYTTPAISTDQAVELATQHAWSPVLRTRLVIAQVDPNADPVDHLVWAVELDASPEYRCGFCISFTGCPVHGEADAAIIFLNATSGELERCYQHIPGAGPPPSEGPPSPNVPQVPLGGAAGTALGAARMSFLDPGYQPESRITGPEAVAIITEAGMPSRNVEFGRLLDSNADPPLDTLAWAIELDDGVAFVDAESGQILYELRGFTTP